MKVRTRLMPLGLALVALAGSLPGSAPVPGQEKAPAKGHAWTAEEAMQQLRLYPRDAYLQYVALQLARREGRADDVADRIDRLIGGGDDFFRGANERVSRVDLFSLFSGALAVQESLQLDTMRGENRPRPRQRLIAVPAPKVKEKKDEERLAAEARRKAEKVKVASLTGPTIKSHPWEKMLAGKKPDIGNMARYVPEDFYLIEFRSLVKLLEVMDQSDLWSTHLFNQAAQEARTQLVGERLKKQLVVETTKILRPFYDTVVEEVAVAGSDLYLREGSDVTLLFRSKQPEVLKTRMNGFLANAERDPDVRRTEGDYLGVAFTHVATPDRAVCVYSAYPTPDLHVRSNSRVAFQRIIEAVQGKDAGGKAVRRLGDSDEFAYIRTLMPRGAKEEDGFVYLSDPFIRRLVGQEVKLTERRRMICYNHLRMIGHAALIYRTEHGKAPASLEELAKAGCAPGEFGKEQLACPDGGKYTLSADGLTGVCSVHGHAHSLTPCCEIPVKEVTGEEADEYKQFLDEYNQYWRTFFDPIALRIQATPQRYRIETIVLPLIDNTIYTTLARVLGGKPEPLDALPVPKRSIFSLAVRLNKRELLDSIGMGHLLTEAKPKKQQEPSLDTFRTAHRFKLVGLALHNYHDQHGRLPTDVAFDKQEKKTRLSWRVHLLPYMGLEDLYREFRLDELWDSEHNKKLITRIPAEYQSSNAKLTAAGKTRMVAPVGEQTIFPSTPNRGIRFTDIRDGLSNTIMVVEADDDHAVIWTKPDDLVINAKRPLNGLWMRPPGGFLAQFGDGQVMMIRQTIRPENLAALFTRAGGEALFLQPEDTIEYRPQRDSGLMGFSPELINRLKLGEFLAKGIGNQVGLHVYDAEPMFDFSLPSFLGTALGTFGGRQMFGGLEGLMMGTMMAALNAPVYVSLPVQDPKVVDEFLARLDEYLAVLAREKDMFGGFFRIEQDFYRLPSGQGKNIRTYGFRFGPLKWRFFWGRLGNGLYVASKPYILEDLLAVANEKSSPDADRGPAAHGMVRLRPQNWNRVLTDYRLGWAENNREACLHNLGPLSSLSRALTAGKPGRSADEMELELRRLGARLYGVHFFCPEEGRYAVSPDGKAVTCGVHGSAMAPRQQVTPSEKSNLGRLLREFADMTLALTFMEDGLHAVVTIEKK